MSSVVKTVTPFINREILLKALAAVGCKYTVQGDIILTDRYDYNGVQKFQFGKGRYMYVHDSDHWGNIDTSKYKTVSSFLQAVGAEYNAIYRKRLEELEYKRLAAIAEEERKKAEEEKLRLERERKEYVEKQRSTIVAKAKEQGYDVRETTVNNNIKLVLVRTTY